MILNCVKNLVSQACLINVGLIILKEKNNEKCSLRTFTNKLLYQALQNLVPPKYKYTT